MEKQLKKESDAFSPPQAIVETYDLIDARCVLLILWAPDRIQSSQHKLLSPEGKCLRSCGFK